MSGTLRLGLVGCSWFALRAHIPAILALEQPQRGRVFCVLLTAICSRTRKSLAKAEARVGRALVKHKQMEAMFADPQVDVVLIVLPIPLMAKAVEAALRAGKHVLSEKPAAHNLDVALQVCRRALSHCPVLQSYPTAVSHSPIQQSSSRNPMPKPYPAVPSNSPIPQSYPRVLSRSLPIPQSYLTVISHSPIPPPYPTLPSHTLIPRSHPTVRSQSPNPESYPQSHPTVPQLQRSLPQSAPVWAVVENWAHKPSVLWIRQRLQERAIGRVLSAHCAHHEVVGVRGWAEGWRGAGDHDGGWLLDLGVHWVRMLRVLLGEPVSCSANVKQLAAHLPPCDTMNGWITFDHIASAVTLSLSFSSPAARSVGPTGMPSLTLYGESGSICWWAQDASGGSRLRMCRDGISADDIVLSDDWVTGGVERGGRWGGLGSSGIVGEGRQGGGIEWCGHPRSI